ncbi:MAG TPA: hypothetical protein VEQ59_02700 [Polyangiaceae bacterium]|nr:hypothetical protein [Polyangiaceae bacterium]
MTLRRLRYGVVLVGLALMGAACGGAASADGDARGGGGSTVGDKNSSGAGGSNASGANSGGSDHVGGSNSGGGAGGSSSLSGGTGGTAAGGATALGGCHQAADCPAASMPDPFVTAPARCLSPEDPTPQPSCGAPGWCGQCNCPPQPTAPQGNGMVCQTNAECPAPAVGMKRASLCNAGACSECSVDTDCPAATPVCSTVQSLFGSASFNFRACVPCGSDAQCSGSTPRCGGSAGVRSCVACLSNQDCARGVCTQGSCVAGCTSDEPCADRFTTCSANERCEARACVGDDDCPPPNAACTGGYCARRTCQDDAQCDAGGSCVNAACYEAPGRCFYEMRVP